MVNAKNNCSWLLNGRFEYCDKPCVNELCKQHRAQIFRGQNKTYPCRKCARGVISESRLCPRCGASRVQHKLVSTEKKAHRAFAKVLVELQNQNLIS